LFHRFHKFGTPIEWRHEKSNPGIGRGTIRTDSQPSLFFDAFQRPIGDLGRLPKRLH
jgi:hypothetical protein